MTTSDVQGPRYRSFWLLWCAVVALMTACGAASSLDSTRGTIGSAEAGPEELALGTASTTPGEPEAATEITVDVEPADEPIGPPLPPLSSAEQIHDVVADVHGPTRDVSAQMNRIVAFPQIATPPHATVTEVRADVRQTLDNDHVTVVSEVMLDATGSTDELIAFYSEELDQLGWELMATSALMFATNDVERLDYQIPDTAYTRDDFQLAIMALDADDAAQSDTARSQIRLRYVELRQADDLALRQRLQGWANDVPLPDGGEVTGAGIQTSSVGRNSLHYSLALRYPDVTPGTVAGQLRDALPAGDFTIDPQPPMGDALDDWVYLDHPFFDDSRVSTHVLRRSTESLGTTVNIDARVELSRAG